MARKIGIIGGSFDPIHIGHLIIAQDAIEQFQLDQALFVPAWQAPLKAKLPGAAPQDRMAMVEAAIADDPRFGVSDLDFSHHGVSYSIDTVRRLHERHPDSVFYWIIGADQLALLHQWREIAMLAKLVQFIVFQRQRYANTNPSLPEDLRLHFARPRAIEISSTEIRRRLSLDQPANYFLPASVLAYIKAENLYRSTTNL